MNKFKITQEEELAIARASELDKVLITHPDMERALQGINRCIVESAHFAEPVGCMLLAEGGMGKSSVCDYMQKSLQTGTTKTEDAEITLVPTIYAEVPPTVSLSYLATNILTGLHDINPNQGTIPVKTKRIVTLLRNCETKVLFLDEIHNLLDKNRLEKGNVASLRWLRALSNYGICMCLSGTPGCEEMIAADQDYQLARRFKHHYRMNPLKAGKSDNPGELYYFLTKMGIEIKRRFSIEFISTTLSHKDTVRFYAATHGNLSFVMTLIKEALILVLLEKRATLTLKDLAEVWQKDVTKQASIVKENPFL